MKTAVKEEAVSNKVASRFCNTDTWFVENFRDERLIEFKADEIEIKQSVFLDNCVNCGIVINPKIKQIFMQNCKKV